jgi:hypothetical protein
VLLLLLENGWSQVACNGQLQRHTEQWVREEEEEDARAAKIEATSREKHERVPSPMSHAHLPQPGDRGEELLARPSACSGASEE